MDIECTVFECVDWVDLAQDRDKVTNFQQYGDESFFPYNARNSLSI